MKIIWCNNNYSTQLNDALKALSQYFNICETINEFNVQFLEIESGLVIRKNNGIYEIGYSSLRFALRGIYKLLTVEEINDVYHEESKLKDFRVMIDNSRNAVMTLARMKEFIAYSALLGYTSVCPYMEDIYEIPQYPAFGYLRGAFSKDELRQMNDFGRSLGVKLVASIQTLGHLQQIFHYKYFDNVKDTSSNLLVDEDKTYELIDNMINVISQCFDTKEICIGMDEVHSLGKGSFLDRFGYEDQANIFARHIKRVCGILEKYHYPYPTVWSDMFIKMFSETHSYFDTNVIIPNDYKNKLGNIKLGYWEYDTSNKDFISKMLEIHQQFENPICVVTGLTTWFTPCYKHWKSKDVLDAFAEVVNEGKIDDLILSIWGDDGAYCDPNSYYLGMFYLSEKIYTGSISKTKFNNLFHLDYDFYTRCSEVDRKFNGETIDSINQTRYMTFANCFYDDPLYGIGYNNERQFDEECIKRTYEHYKELSNDLVKYKNNNNSYSYYYLSSKICELKLSSRMIALTGYFENDKECLMEAIKQYSMIITLFEELDQVFETMWLANFKTYGLDVMQTRFAGYIRRYQFAKAYLERFRNGEITLIPELEESKKHLKAIKIKDFYSNYGVITVVR